MEEKIPENLILVKSYDFLIDMGLTSFVCALHVWRYKKVLWLLEDDCVAYVVAKERSMAQKPKKEEDKENKGDGDNDSFDYILRKICAALRHGKTAIIIKF